jgi:hypothetical protein
VTRPDEVFGTRNAGDGLLHGGDDRPDAMKERGLRSSWLPGGCWVLTQARQGRPLMEGYCGQQFVGIDLHRRRSVIVRTTVEGQVLESTRIVNDPDRLAAVIGRAGEAPEVRRLVWASHRNSWWHESFSVWLTRDGSETGTIVGRA